MLSVCGSIYQNGNIVPFVRSILDLAGDPDDIEFSIVEDEAGSDLMAGCWDRIRSMTHRLKVTPITKEERVAYFGECIAFYERESIWPAEVTRELRDRLGLYESGRIPRIWFPPAKPYNLSVEASSGDVILNTPVDLIAHFDLTDLYRKFKEALKTRAFLSLHLGLKGGNMVRHHGTRIFNRTLFAVIRKTDRKWSPKPFGFDERWFPNAFFDDDWNTRAQMAGAESRGWEEFFGERRFLSMPDSPWQPEYLCERMLERFPSFMQTIREYQAR